MAGELAVQAAFTEEQVGLIKRTICAGATNDELALFMNQCRRTGLDPFSRQIHAVKRGGKMTIQVGIDGFRLIAERTGQADGQEGPFWCGEDGVWRDVWLSKDKPAACKVVVYRKGQARGYAGVAQWAEFYQSSGGMWDRMPATMIAKVAETIALRKAFPQDLSGLYEPNELGDAEFQPAEQAAPAPQTNPAPATGSGAAKPPAKAWTPPALHADIAAKPAPASGADLSDRVAWVAKQLAKHVPAFAHADLDDAICDHLDLGDGWTYPALTADQAADGWGVVVRYVGQEAKAWSPQPALAGMESARPVVYPR